MPLRRLLGLLLNNPRVIQALADSPPIRAAARFTAYLFLRGKQAIEEEARKPKIVNEKGFKTTFQEELRKGLREFQEKQKNKKRP